MGRETPSDSGYSHFCRGEGPLFGFTFACGTILYFILLIKAFVKLLTSKSSVPNPTFDFEVKEGPSFRRYRGRTQQPRRKRNPIYGLLFKKGRKDALRFRDGKPKAKPPEPGPPRRYRRPSSRLPSRSKKKPQDWAKLTRKEVLQNRGDEWERVKPKFLHQSFVVYDMQYGVNLSEFVGRLDPVASFRTIQVLSDPHVLRSKGSTKLKHRQALFDQVKEEALKYRVQVASSSVSYEPPGLAVYLSTGEDDVPVVINTGASFCLTPNIGDFITPLSPSTSSLTGLNSETAVSGTGTVEWNIQDATGMIKILRCEAYYVPQAKIRLFSPQQHFQDNNGGTLLCDQFKVQLTLFDGGTLEFPYQAHNRLPLMLTRDYFQSSDRCAGLTVQECTYLANTQALPSIVDTTNQNLTGAQKELLLWHWKLGHVNMR